VDFTIGHFALHSQKMKAAVASVLLICLLAVAHGHKSTVEAEYEVEYIVQQYEVDPTPEFSGQDVDLVELVEYEMREVPVDIAYTEYEYQYEYEYAGPPEVDVDQVEVEDLTSACPDMLTRDCQLKCAPAYWIGNGICDDGSADYDFNCDIFWADGTDCDPPMDFSTVLHYAVHLESVNATVSAPMLAFGIMGIVGVAMVAFKR